MDLQKYEQVAFLEEKSPAICNESPEMFIPAAVGLLNAWDVLRPVVVPVVVVTVVTTVLVMGVTGQVTQRVIRWERKRKEGKEK